MRTAAITLSIVGALALAACSDDDGDSGIGGGSDLDDLDDLLVALQADGIDCGGKVEPYVADEDETEIGDPPVAEFTCSVDGVEIRGTMWDSANNRGITMTMGAEMACGFGAESFQWIESGPWAVAAEAFGAGNSEGDMDAMNERIADALGIEPTTKECDG